MLNDRSSILSLFHSHDDGPPRGAVQLERLLGLRALQGGDELALHRLLDEQSDVRAGERISVRLSPASALRWNRGWCPGVYDGRIVLHDAAHTVGRFTIRVPG